MKFLFTCLSSCLIIALLMFSINAIANFNDSKINSVTVIGNRSGYSGSHFYPRPSGISVNSHLMVLYYGGRNYNLTGYYNSLS